MSSDQIKNSAMYKDSNSTRRIGNQVSPAPSQVVLGTAPDVSPFTAVLASGPLLSFQKLGDDHVIMSWSTIIAQGTNAGAFITWSADVPAAYRPQGTRFGICSVTNNSVIESGQVSVLSTGDLTFASAAGVAFTGTGNGGVGSGSLLYSLTQQ